MDLKSLFLEKNEGSVDRALRIVAGLVLIGAFTQNYVGGLLNYLVLLVALIFLVTGLTGHCSVYALLGISTRK